MKELARLVSEEHKAKGLFSVEFHGWDWIEGILADNIKIAIDHRLVSLAIVNRIDQSTSEISKEIGERFVLAISLMNEGRYDHDKFTLQSISNYLGHPNWRRLEEIATGRADTGASEIEQYCEKIGINSSWVLEGKEEPFLECRNGFRRDIQSIYAFIQEMKPQKIVFLRSTADWPDVCIVLQLDDFRYVLLEETFPVRSNIGAGGRGQIFDLCCLLRRMRTELSLSYRGWHISKQQWVSLVAGEIYPGSILHSPVLDYWWDDFADLAIDRVPDDAPHLHDLRAAIELTRSTLAEFRSNSVNSQWKRELLEWGRF